MIRAISATALVAAFGLAAPLSAQGTGQAPSQPAGQASSMMEHMRRMDSLESHLDTAVAMMNRTTGEARVKAMTEALNTLVAERKAMHTHMHEMQSHEGGAKGDGHAGAAKTHEHQAPAAVRPDTAPRVPR